MLALAPWPCPEPPAALSWRAAVWRGQEARAGRLRRRCTVAPNRTRRLASVPLLAVQEASRSRPTRTATSRAVAK
eukprot:11460837-Alexandrium_andersonii.AAC.1